MKTQIQIIDTLPLLEDAVSDLKTERVMAVDMEADSMYHYQEKVCLLQIATPGRTLVIDPLALDHLDPLKPVFEDSRIRKVFHGADYDMRSLYRDFGIDVRHLFDTELACRFLGHEKTGLDAVLGHYFNIQLDKKYQKKDWSQRPLPEEMIHYAAKDTAHLIALSEILMDQLKQKRRLGWVQEECEILSNVRPNQIHPGPFFIKFKGAGRLRPRSLARLEAVLVWRDKMARKRDRPAFKILGNQEILRLIENPPKDMAALSGLRILSDKQLQMFGAELLAAIASVRELAKEALPVFPREERKPAPAAETCRRIEVLKRWRDRKAEKLGMDPALLMNKETLAAVAALDPLNSEVFGATCVLKSWQRRAFSREMANVLRVK